MAIGYSFKKQLQAMKEGWKHTAKIERKHSRRKPGKYELYVANKEFDVAPTRKNGGKKQKPQRRR